MATIGLRDLFMAPITEADGVETYGVVRRLAKAIKAELSVETTNSTLYADDSVDVTIKEFVKGALKLTANDLKQEDVAEILGQTIDADGVIFAGENDSPPYFAIGFRAKKTDGTYRYVWLYKVKFKVPNENYETKGENVNFITPELEGEFIKRDKDGLWKADFTGSPSDTIASVWFEEVREPTGAVEG